MTDQNLSAQVNKAIEATHPKEFLRSFGEISSSLSALDPADTERLRESATRMMGMTMVGLSSEDLATQRQLVAWLYQPAEAKQETKGGLSEMVSSWFRRK